MTETEGSATDRMMASPRFKRFLILAIAASVISLIAVFVYSFLTNREELVSSLTQLNPWIFVIAIGLHVAALVSWSMRLVWLTDGAGYPISFTTAFEAVFSGVFAAALTPARLGGEPVRFALLTSNEVPPREASLIVLLERGFDTLLFIILGALATLILVPRLPQSAILAIVAPLGLLFLILLIVIPLLILLKPEAVHPIMSLANRFVGEERIERAKEWTVLEMARLRRALATVLSEHPSRVPLAALATAVTWGLEFSVIAYLLDALGHEIPFLVVALGAVLVVLLTTLPLLPGGAGVAELGALGVFGAFTDGLGFTFVAAWRASTYYVDCTAGGFFALRFAGAETMEVLERSGKRSDAEDQEHGGDDQDDGPSAGPTGRPPPPDRPDDHGATPGDD